MKSGPDDCGTASGLLFCTGDAVNAGAFPPLPSGRNIVILELSVAGILRIRILCCEIF